MLILGIDEAGRGCVIGPMVICGIVINTDVIDELISIGVKDSKELSRKKRELLFPQIIDKVNLVIKKFIQPKIIDQNNINIIEFNNWIKIIKTCYKNKIVLDKVFIDMPVPYSGIKKYIEKLNILLQKENIWTTIIGENNADKKFIPVSAASIVAKVYRDRAIEKLKNKYGDFGSGYPSDKNTKDFLRNNDNCSIPIIRKKWKIHI